MKKLITLSLLALAGLYSTNAVGQTQGGLIMEFSFGTSLNSLPDKLEAYGDYAENNSRR